MVSIHFPSRIPIKTLRVLLHASFASTDAITWVTAEFQVVNTRAPDALANSETVSCTNGHLIRQKNGQGGKNSKYLAAYKPISHELSTSPSL